MSTETFEADAADGADVGEEEGGVGEGEDCAQGDGGAEVEAGEEGGEEEDGDDGVEGDGEGGGYL